MEKICQSIRKALVKGESSEEISAHLQNCKSCRIANSIDGSVSQDRPITRDTARYNQKDIANGMARGLLVAVSAGTIIAVLSVRLRPDFPSISNTPFFLTAALLALALAALICAVTRPIYTPELSRGKLGALAAFTTVVIFAPAFFVESSFLAPISFSELTLRCLGTGFVITIPFMILGVRAIHPSWRTVPTVLVFLGAAILGNLGLLFRCPVSGPEHVLCGHATLIPITLAIGFALAISKFKRRK